jgi:hypothetical protein
MEQLGHANLILDVLGARDSEFASICSGEAIHVEREAPVPEGYFKSLQKLSCDIAPVCVLVARDEVDERQLCGFRLRPWKEVSIAMRKAIAGYAEDCEHLAIVAMMPCLEG